VDDRRSSDALISILRSTSYLLEHYGYAGHDPSLSELQRSIRCAIKNLHPESPPDDIDAKRLNGHAPE